MECSPLAQGGQRGMASMRTIKGLHWLPPQEISDSFQWLTAALADCDCSIRYSSYYEGAVASRMMEGAAGTRIYWQRKHWLPVSSATSTLSNLICPLPGGNSRASSRVPFNASARAASSLLNYLPSSSEKASLGSNVKMIAHHKL